ncbi:Uncharacterized conserved protein, DUF2336 family [Cohaesibacter marisflavi]|uniref:Uncharacterized conserved protein, DUF2336 family n=1 Tax=Cohaesibacter marisflavi TaxID=655353 RepID=A0A1I5K7F2_9HYPH|nr:DUF2336 domain-containing protein [Cohaesibacter marisflavi]SFO80653.1 Uncharacterized conserved protein, DUF2336 family [Cohaesibacter marisflavi]
MIVEKFLSWIETAPVDRRAEATSALARAYLYSPLDEAEKAAAETALTILLDDPAPIVREALAQALKQSPYAPRPVILSLAQDIDAVAVPVIVSSPVLLDSELVDMVADRGLLIQCAVASRPSVSPALCAAMAEVADSQACCIMLENPGAQIAVFSLRRLAERFGQMPSVRNMLLSLDGLPIDIRQMLIVQLGDALQQLSLVQSFVSSERRTSLVKDACDKATVDLASCCAHGDELEALVEHLRLSGQLTADLLIRSLCMGNVSMFVKALVSLTDLSEKRVQACVADPSEALVQTLCKKAGISERVAPVILSALVVYRELVSTIEGDMPRSRFGRMMVERILSDYNDFAEDELDDLLALLRRFATQIARDDARSLSMRMKQVTAA